MTLGGRSAAVDSRRSSVGVPAGVPRRRRDRVGGAGHGVRCTAGRDGDDRRRGRRRLVVHGDERRAAEYVDAVVRPRRTADVHECDDGAATSTTITTGDTHIAAAYQLHALYLAMSTHRHTDRHTQTPVRQTSVNEQ